MKEEGLVKMVVVILKERFLGGGFGRTRGSDSFSAI